MTVAELIHFLEQACEGESTDDVEVRVAWSQFHPLEAEIDAGPDITIVEVQNDTYERHDKVVYLPVASTGYLPGVVSKALGWR